MYSFSVTKNGKELDSSLYTWDEETRNFSTKESNLVLNFNNGPYYTFNTGSYCTFNTGPYCAFNTGLDCIFNTGPYCAFNTGSDCTFNTGSDCTFNTGSDCTFDTGSYCTFNTESDCAFNTESDCTFDTESDCVFDTVSDCTFKAGSNCTFNTESDCTFKAGSDCTFDTGSYCTFNTGSECTFKAVSYCIFDTGDNCTFNTESDCTFKAGLNCTFDTGDNCTFKTGSDCTFNTGSKCVIIRNDVFEVITLEEGKKIKLNDWEEKGYTEVKDTKTISIDGKNFMDKNTNDIRHLYLYAKGHYERSNKIDDLKIIVGVISWVYPEFIIEKDIHIWLLKEVYKYLCTEDDFISFLNDDMFNKKDLIDRCLSVLKFQRISDIDIELGKPDPNILPLNDEYYND